MSKKILKNIIITIMLAILFVAIALGVYTIYHRIAENEVLSKFTKNLNQIRIDGKYRVSCVETIELDNFKIEIIYEDTHKNGFSIEKMIRRTTNSEGVQNIEGDSLYYSDGVEEIYVDNIQKLYRVSPAYDSYTLNSIPNFSQISTSINNGYSSLRNYDVKAWKFKRIEEFDGQKCFVLSNEDEEEWVYVSKETYLPIGIKNSKYECKCKFEVNPEVSDSEVECPDLSEFSRVEYVREYNSENGDEITNVNIYAPDGTVKTIEDTNYVF